VVAISSDLDRTVAALQAAGLDLRRIREEPTPAGAPRQAFFRLGAVILEVVQSRPRRSSAAAPNRPPSSGALPCSARTSTRPLPGSASGWARSAALSSPAVASPPCAAPPASRSRSRWWPRLRKHDW